MNALSQPLERRDDDDLVRRVVAGDRSAFEPLMRRHNRRLFRLARATLRNDAEAEDALQEAYFTAYRRLHQYRGEAALATWLSRVVLNECLARLRRANRRDNVAPIFSPADQESLDQMAISTLERPDDAAVRTEMRGLLERTIDALPESFRIVFVLRCVEELSVEDTAACLNLPEATVRTRHFRARSLLRESLARELDLAERDAFEFAGARCDRIVAGVMARLRSTTATGPVKDDDS
jgi:RNA polymerase sigma factor (sigma-70 family)